MCTLFVIFFYFFLLRRGRQSYPQPVNNLSHLWITCVRQIGVLFYSDLIVVYIRHRHS